jgi:hypothetical protein
VIAFATVTPVLRWSLAGLCAWTLFLWANRISNAWTSTSESTGAKVTSTVLAVVFVTFAVTGVVVLVRSWRRPDAAVPARFLLAFSAWTIGVWAVRLVGIVAGGHSVGFVVVHAVLGLVSMALAVVVARAARATAVASSSGGAVTTGGSDGRTARR